MNVFFTNNIPLANINVFMQSMKKKCKFKCSINEYPELFLNQQLNLAVPWHI